MAYWIFKCNPDHYDFKKRLMDPTPTMTWLVTRFRNDIQPGDVAFLWETGPQGGIRAVMRVDDIPREMPELPSELKFWKPPYRAEVASGGCHVMGTLTHRGLQLSRSQLRSIPGLEKLSVFHGVQQGTNFPVTAEQGDILMRLVGRFSVPEDDDAVTEAAEVSYARGQGFQLDSKLRKKLEKYAMNEAIRYFQEQGYSVEDHCSNHPYDLYCKRGKELLYVEVKGTQTTGQEIILTAGEVAFAQAHVDQMGLFVLHSIQVSEDKGDYKLSGGQRNVILPWDVSKGVLKPMSFKYEMPY